MFFEKSDGVPPFSAEEYRPRHADYCILIPIINEGNRIRDELIKAQRSGVGEHADIIICDGGSTDGCTDKEILFPLGVTALLVKHDKSRQGGQLRMGIWWALSHGYKGIVTIDGNNKDSIEDVPHFIGKLEQGYDLVQGSRFIKGGKAVNTPLLRLVSVRLVHAPMISLTAGHWFTDTTNAYRAYSVKYLTDPAVQPLRDIFNTYELLAYLSVRATQIGMKACEIPVSRAYPSSGKTPTKISLIKGNYGLLKILFVNFLGGYRPKKQSREIKHVIR